MTIQQIAGFTRRRPIRLLSLVAVCCTLLSGVALRAQDTTPPPPPTAQTGQQRQAPEAREQEQVDRLTKALKLTPDQVTQLKTIEDGTRQKMLALRDDASTPRGGRRAKMEQIQQDSRTSIRAMLDDRQKTRFDEMMAKQDERRAEHPRNGGTPPSTPPPPTA